MSLTLGRGINISEGTESLSYHPLSMSGSSTPWIIKPSYLENGHQLRLVQDTIILSLALPPGCEPHGTSAALWIAWSDNGIVKADIKIIVLTSIPCKLGLKLLHLHWVLVESMKTC